MAATVLVFCEEEPLRGELLAKAGSLAGSGGAGGAGGVVLATTQGLNLPDDNPDTIARGLAEAAKAANADLVMVGATKKGRDVGPRLAGHLDWPYASDVQELSGEPGKWSASRMVLSGNSKATYSFPKGVVSAVPKTFEGKGTATREAAGVSVPPSVVKVTGHHGKEGGSDFNLDAAAVVVGVGRGFKAKSDIKLAEDLAACFKGGAVGCSRPVAADLKWLGEEHWIGLSGHAIKPKAYIACGVSGQIQHIAGIRGSKLIVAINTNKDAPIFGVCDYGVVGDLYKVLPKLTQLLRK